MNPGPGVWLRASAGSVVNVICWYYWDGAGLYLAKGLQVNEFRLGLVTKYFHFSSSRLNNVDIVLKSQFIFLLSTQ